MPRLAHPRLEPAAVAALRLGHPPQDLRLPVGHPLRDQVVDRAGNDLPAPRLEQPITDLAETSVMLGA